MQIFKKALHLNKYLKEHQLGSFSTGLVPTMGALHQGHAALVKQSLKENDLTVCSVFVNPVQFNNQEDLDKYPRTLDKDVALLKELGCDIVFCPDVDEIYRQPAVLKMDFGFLEHTMEGRHRPGHFNGVALVVSKLFHIVDPTSAYFGQKDLQQYKVIDMLVKDLSFNVRLNCVPIVRDSDGLALSSRNRRLSTTGRVKASAINEILIACEKDILQGGVFSKIKLMAKERLSLRGLTIDYLALVDADTLDAVDNKTENKSVALCIAAYVDGVRLIDNRIF